VSVALNSNRVGDSVTLSSNYASESVTLTIECVS
jgi:hypothetical protein